MTNHSSSSTLTIRTKRLLVRPDGCGAQFLGLPFEIRQQIYSHMLCHSRIDHLNLLYTCRLIHREGLRSFQSRPLVCYCQEDFISRLSRISQPHLDNVTGLRLAIADLEPATVRPSLNDLVRNSCTKIQLNPYHVELKHITSGLAWLRRLESITIMRQGDPTRRQGPQILLDGVVKWLNKSVTKLKHLCIQVDNYQLSHLHNLQHLRSLQISGFSESTPEQTQAALCNLPSLQNLHIVPGGYIMREPYFRCREPVQSLTPPVISAIKSLRSLTLIDPPETPVHESPFLTEAMFAAIKTVHAKSLTQLTVSSLHALPKDISTALATLLHSTSKLHRLTLAFPDIPNTAALLLLLFSDKTLPSSLTSLDVLVDHNHGLKQETDFVLDAVTACSHNLPNLETVTCLVSEGQERAHQDATLQLLLSESGAPSGRNGGGDERPFAVKWLAWRPFDDDDNDYDP